MALAEGDKVPEALVLDRPNKPLGVGVEVWAPRRQTHQLYARRLEQGSEVSCIKRLTVEDDGTERRQRARLGAGEVAGDLGGWERSGGARERALTAERG